MKVRVIQTPVFVVCTCDECEHEEEVTYNEFVNSCGDPIGWEGCRWYCSECGHKNEITDQEWE